MPTYEKNQTPTGSISLEMRDTLGAFVSGTPTVTVSKDAGAYATGAGTLTAVSGGTGEWEYLPTSGETNCGKFKVKAVLTGAVTVTREVLPEVAYTAVRAGYLDALNGIVLAIVAGVWNAAIATYTAAGSFGAFLQSRLDVATSSRLASSGYTVPPNDAAIQADVTAALTAQGYTATRAGYLDTLNGLVATIWGYAGRTLAVFGDSTGITTLLSRLTVLRAGYLDNLTNLDASVSSRLATSGYTAPPTLSQIWNYAGSKLSSLFDGIAPIAGFFVNSPSGGTGGGTTVVISVPSALPGYTIPEGDLPPIRRGDSWTAQITGLGTLTGRTKLWASGKRDVRRTDGQADFVLTETGGLGTIGASVPIAGQSGTLTVNDAAAGTVTLTLSAAATAAIGPATLAYDIQCLNGGITKTLASGNVEVVADVTRATA